MREIKFRAWAKKTVDHYISDPIDIAFKEFERIEPRNNQSDEWDKWYKDREDRICELRNEMKHDAEERYEITHEMITNFSVKADGGYIRPYRYEILDVMQYTGLHDKNGKEIYEGDIVKCVSETHSNLGKYPTGKFDTRYYKICGMEEDAYCFGTREIGKEYISRGILRACAEKYYEVIGNIYENPELLEVSE